MTSLLDERIQEKHKDLLLQIFPSDDGGYFVTGGGTRLGARNLQELLNAVNTIISSAFGRTNDTNSPKIHMDN